MAKRSDEAPAEIKALRSSLGFNQKAFAQALEVSKAAVSAWERGLYEPSPETYIRMGKLANRNDVLWFLERAGLDRKLILSAAGNLLRENDTARILRISPDAVLRFIASGKLIARRAGSTAHYWISYDSIIDLARELVAQRESALRPPSKNRVRGK